MKMDETTNEENTEDRDFIDGADNDVFLSGATGLFIGRSIML